MQRIWSLISAEPLKTIAAIVAALVVLNTQLPVIPSDVLQQIINVLVVLGVPVAVSANGKAQAQAKVASVKAEAAHERLNYLDASAASIPDVLPMRAPPDRPS